MRQIYSKKLEQEGNEREWRWWVEGSSLVAIIIFSFKDVRVLDIFMA